MRRVPPPPPSLKPRVVVGASTLAWTDPLKRAHVDQQESSCLSCPDAPCMTSHLSGAPNGSTAALCPVDAVSIDQASGRATVGDGCIGCGLCIWICPVGAIEWSNGLARVGGEAMEDELDTTTLGFEEWLLALAISSTTDKLCDDAVAQILPLLAALKGRNFYLLTEKVLRSLGIAARMSNMGDTSQRTDLIVTTPAGSIPVEIKSATETPIINAKSIQQAVENKLTISRIDGLEALNPLSTWVVGYEYPPDRTHHLELVEDVYATYGIRVGLLSIGTLLKYLVRQQRGHEECDLETLFMLRGIPCDA